MVTFSQEISKNLTSIGFALGGQPATPLAVEMLFRVSFRTIPPNPPLALADRLCEEHLTAALTAVRQSIADRQSYFDAGEKFATMALGLASDTTSAALLASEAAAMSLRHDASAEAANGEASTEKAYAKQEQQMLAFRDSVVPNASGPTNDANRNRWIAYIGNRGDGYSTMEKYWGAVSQHDNVYSEFGGEYTLGPTAAVIDLQAELAKRATLANFRVMRDRATVDLYSAQAVHAASLGRLTSLRKTEQYDAAVSSLAVDRSTAADSILQTKIAMTRDIALLDFYAQMQLHKRRAQDLFAEAMERAGAALTGLRTIYGFVLPDIPASVTIESAEDLLFWCRSVARIIIGYDPQSMNQRVTFSIREQVGSNWAKRMQQGVTIDAQSLMALGNVVRLRDMRTRFTGKQRTSFQTNITTPTDVNDRSVSGSSRAVTQVPTMVHIIAAPALDQQQEAKPSSSVARVVHNICPSGVWTLQTDAVPKDADDLLLDLDISYLLG
jgi:hypothetical protein